MLTAVYTPFDAGRGIDEAAFAAQCKRLVDAGSGLVPCGTTGETPTLSTAEWTRLVTIAVETSAGRVPVIPGTGSNDTRGTIAMTRLAAELGADAALVVTPPYSKPPQASLRAHFLAVADEGGLPILLYNVPGRTAVNLEPETALSLAADPRFIGIKDAAAELGQFDALVTGAPPGFAVLSGDDAWTYPLLALGGHGVVSVVANVAPAPVVAMVEAARAGDFARARAIHRQLAPLISALFTVSNPIPVKFVASLLGHCRPDLRLPLTAEALEIPARERLEALVHDLELGR